MHSISKKTVCHSSFRESSLVRYAIPFVLVLLWPMYSPVIGQEQMQTPDLPVEHFVLDNGLKVALSYDPMAPRSTVCVAYHVGSKNERSGLTGFAHFFEHMMFRGTLNVPNFDIPLQPAGGAPNAFTSNDMTVYFETVSNNYVERALFMEAERMAFLSSGLSPEKFDTEREIVKNERRQRMENVPYGLASEAISAFVYPEGHPYSWSVIGSMRDLDNADLGDLREFFYEFYHPGNATLVVVGSFDQEETREWIHQYFGVLRTGPEITPVENVTEPMPEPARIVQSDQVRFPRVYWTWRTVAESNYDAAALEVLSGILSRGEASRLYQDLVVKNQLASDTTAMSEVLEIDGTFTIYATATPDTEIESLDEQVRATIAKLIEEGPTEQELQRVLISMQTATINSLTSTMARAVAISTGLSQYDDPHHSTNQLNAIMRVTTNDIRRVARQYLDRDAFSLVVQPVGDGEETPATLAGPPESERRVLDIAAAGGEDDPRWARLPGPTAQPPFQAPQFETVELSNGLEVWLAAWDTLPLTTVQLVIPTGRVDDPNGKSGLSNLMSRTWDKGTQGMSPAEFAAALEMHGTRLSIGSTYDTTVLSYSVTTPQLANATELIAQLVREPGFDSDAVELERELMLSDLAQGPSRPTWIGGRVFDRLVFGSTSPLGRPGAGFDETVSQLSRDDVVNHYQSAVNPSQAKLIVVGSADPEETRRMLEETFGKWSNDASSHETAIEISPAPTDCVYAVDKPGAVQSVIMLGRPWRGRSDQEKVLFDIANRIFAGDFLSRVNQNLRERNGFTYGARANFSYFETGSQWRMSTSVRADVTGAALREIFNEIEAARDSRPLSVDEIKVASDSALNNYPEQFATPASIASELADVARFGLPHDTFTEYASALQNVPAEETAAIMRELADPEKLTVLVVGDRESINSQLSESGFDRIVWLDTNGDPE